MGMAFHCSKCGTALPSGAQFCAACGSAVTPPSKPDWPHQASMSTAYVVPAHFDYAGFWIRFFASLIDAIVSQIIALILGASAGATLGFLQVSLDAITIIGYGIGLLTQWLYYSLLECGPWQATIGKKLLGVIVVDEKGEQISFARATGRYLGKVISGVILGIGFIMAGFTARKQALHDSMAGTLVIKKSSPSSRF
ncbi:MAG: RDD family protein [Chloroflexi bacterium]|nr:RDD family protein [Chloroflexota bacterium]